MKQVDDYLGTIHNRQYTSENVGETAEAFAVLAIISLAQEVYRVYYSKAGKACKGLPLREREKCVDKYEIKALEEEIKSLKSNIYKCKKDKNPDKCRKKINKVIEKKVTELNNLKARYNRK